MLHGFNLFVAGVVYTGLVALAGFAGGFFFAKRNLTKVLEVTKQVADTAGSVIDTVKKATEVK